MTLNLNDNADFFFGKKVLLYTVNKDTINFLKLYKRYNNSLGWTIKAVFDITLEYRHNVREKLMKYIGEIPVITSIKDLTNIIEDKDVLIDFEYAHETALDSQLEEYNPQYWDIAGFENKVRSDYQRYVSELHGKEYNFVLRQRLESFLNRYLFDNYDIFIMSAVGYPLYIFDEDTEEFYDKAEQHIVRWAYNALDFDSGDTTLYDIRQASTHQHPVFVVSTDFGGGKSSYLLEQLDSGNDIMSPDLYFAFFDVGMFYGACTVMSHLDENLYNALTKRQFCCLTEKPIYIKLEGGLKSYCIPCLSRSDINALGNIHRYYDDYEFHIIVKEDEDMQRTNSDIDLFCSIHHIAQDKVKVFRSINYCESFEEVV